MTIHVYHDGPDGDPQAWAIWLDDRPRQDGLCIGIGRTFEDAHRDALAGLTDALAALQRLEVADAMTTTWEMEGEGR